MRRLPYTKSTGCFITRVRRLGPRCQRADFTYEVGNLLISMDYRSVIGCWPPVFETALTLRRDLRGDRADPDDGSFGRSPRHFGDENSGEISGLYILRVMC